VGAGLADAELAGAGAAAPAEAAAAALAAGIQAMPTGLRKPLANSRRLPLARSISQIAARPSSAGMPFSATLLLLPTVA